MYIENGVKVADLTKDAKLSPCNSKGKLQYQKKLMKI
jgi:hypothetical protein